MFNVTLLSLDPRPTAYLKLDCRSGKMLGQ